MLSICGLIFLAFAAFLGFTLVLPASLELQSLQQQRESVLQRLNRAQEEEEEAHDRFIWMMDPEYFEQIARDRANQAKEGETVIRLPRAISAFRSDGGASRNHARPLQSHPSRNLATARE